jgi:hypothetical protein
MKRTANSLQKERGEAERDERLRRQLQVDADAAERAARISQVNAAKAKATEALRQHWKQANIMVASNYTVGAPAEDPLGADSQVTLRFLPLREFALLILSASYSTL